jgi:O6-methylguanine-DNA--protein-cysteine methyltransferase
MKKILLLLIFFVSDIKLKEASKTTNTITKRRKKNKRLNLLDSDFLPDEAINEAIEKDSENNFFKPKENPISKAFKFIFTSIPLINYFYLKNKSKEIKKAIDKLNDSSQDVDDLITSPIPYGESKNTYTDIAKNLNDVASLISESNKNFQ